MIPTLRALWHRRDGKLRCSWCDADSGRAALPGDSHGACPRHRRLLIAEARADHYGHRPDQVRYSAAVLVCAGIALVAVGLLAGAWLAVHRWGWL